MTKRAFFSRALFFLCLWMIFLNYTAYSSSSSLYDYHPETNKKYFDLLARIQPHSNAEQIDSLILFIHDNPRYTRAYHKLMFLYLYSGEVEKGREYFAQLSLQPSYQFASNLTLALIYLKQGDINLARKYFSLIAKDDSLDFDSLLGLTQFLYSYLKIRDLQAFHQFGIQKKYDLALTFFLSYLKKDCHGTLQVFEQHHSVLEKNYHFLFLAASCYFKLGQYAASDSLFKQGRAMCSAVYDTGSEVQFLQNIGLAKLQLHKPQLYKAYFDTALQKARKINNLSSLPLLYLNLGYYYANKKQFEFAEYNLSRFFKIEKQLKNDEMILKSAHLYGNVLYERKNFSKAIEVYSEGENLSKKFGEVSRLYGFLVAKGNVYEYLNQNNLAREVFKNAYQMAERYNWQKQLFDIRARLANILLKEKKFSAARVIYRENIDYFQGRRQAAELTQLTYWKWKYAQSFQEEKKYKIAKKVFREVELLAQQNHLQSYYLWAIMGIAQCEDGLGKLEDAKVHYSQVLKLLKESNQSADETFADAYLGLGSVHRKNKEWRLAIKQFLRAASYVEKIRGKLNIAQFRLGYFSRETEAYDNLVECYSRLFIQDKNPACLDSLFYFEQMSKSRVLFEILSGNRIKRVSEKNSILLREYKNSQRKLQSDLRRYRLKLSQPEKTGGIAQLLAQIEAEKYTLIEKRLALIQTQGEKGQKVMSAFVVPFSEARSKMKDSQVSLLMYHLSEQASFVLGVNGDKVELFPLKEETEAIAEKIHQLMSPFHNVAGDSILSVAFRADLAHELYQILVAPVAKSIGLSQRVFVVPDGEVFSLSFEMLLAEKTEKSSFTPLDAPDYLPALLINHYSFSYAPSPYFLQQKESGIPSRSNFLIMANPMDPVSLRITGQTSADSLHLSQLGPLPFAEAEARQIKKVVSQATVLRRGQATEANFKKIAPQMPVLHLSTHGLFDHRFDVFSGLFMALGNDTINDGLLLGYEISDLDLDCKLVTLSACETGRGETVAGEGVLGLPRLFLGAGAKTVLMTLWKVDDQFTSELMPAFYKNLFQKKMVVADALSQAKLDVINHKDSEINYEHPFFWAAFCLYGEPTVFVKPFPWLKWAAIIGFLLLDMASVIYFYFIRSKRYKKARHKK